ncbi:hypothetical protein [Leadbetterella sp. DM7]|uniref:hypothetical protein n=1 Tax=Leadbetterella sp. DM7 TaxID=3235085 RepID=UPI00349E49B5
MKKIIKMMVLLLACLPVSGYACEVCKSRQPAALSGITHGSGPQGNADYMIIWGAVVIVGITLFLSIKYLVKPQESAPDHIKNIIIG